MINDNEMRNLFSAESAEHLQRLEDDLLRLEKEPGSAAVYAEAFREAHSLKGAARMLGLDGIETLAHRMEDVLGAARKESVPLSSDKIEALYTQLDTLKDLVKEAVTGAPSAAAASGADARIEPVEVSAAPLPLEEESIDPVLSGEKNNTGPADFHIDTIRVETHRLDALMSQTGELRVTKLRIAQRLEDINDLITQWEHISGKLRKRVSKTETSESPFVEKLNVLLSSLKNGLYEDSSKLNLITAELEDGISRIRLLPLSTVFNLYPRMVRDLAKETAKEVQLVIEGGDTAADKRIVEGMKDPLMHILRNAVDHGIELPDERVQKNKPRMGTITVKAYQTPANVIIEIHDDGQGLDTDAIKRAAVKMKAEKEQDISAMTLSQIQSLIFVSGVSTSSFVSDVSGRGVGLDVVRANVEQLKGTIQISSLPGMGCTITVKLPLTLSTSKVMLVEVDSTKYAVPVEHIKTIFMIHRKKIFSIGGRRTIIVDTLPVPVADLADLLELHTVSQPFGKGRAKSENIPCLVISIGDDTLGLFVDELLDEQDVVLKQYSSIIKRAKNIAGSTILGTGEVCIILNSYDLIKTAAKNITSASDDALEEKKEIRKHILVAEDSLTVRTQMKRILEGAGYDVSVAVDGSEAFSLLGSQSFDGLVSDIQMPNMTGLELSEKIRENEKYKEMPIILVTSLASDDDRKHGMEAGANAYISKPSFDQKVLLDTLRRLI